MRRIRPADGLSNRDIATTSKGAGHHWCMGCDANVVGQYDKCTVCGHLGRPKKSNSPTSIPARDSQ